MGVSPGKLLVMMCVSLSHDMLLNLLTRSAKIEVQFGVCCRFWGFCIIFLMDRDIAFIMKSIPPLISTAKLKGRRY